MKNDELKAKIQRLERELETTRQELGETRRLLNAKNIELKSILIQADEVSHTDALTFLPNRRYIINTLQSEVHRTDRYKIPLSISMIDIDHFKNINDKYGHTIGDLVLRQLGIILRENTRAPDVVGRYGGEEFLLVLPNSPLQAAVGQASRLIKRIHEKDIDVGVKVQLTVSIGIAEYRYDQENWQKFLSRADMALYAAKNAGRDRWDVSK